MTKVVYNNCFGGFSLNTEAMAEFKKRKGIDKEKYVSSCDMDRTDLDLVAIVETGKASGRFADLSIADIPAGTKYRIDEYDGNESVMTIDDYEWSVA
jgi:hypothetical protein